jgi:N-methylhydantoinase A
LHACALAEQLGMRTVLVPPHAGVLSAVGLALAPARREAIASVMRRASTVTAAGLSALVDALGARAGGEAGDEARTWARARYAGQGHELEIPLTPGDDGAALARRFTEWHAARMGFTLAHDVEVVSARHTVSAPGHAVRFARPARDGEFELGRGGALTDDGAALDATVTGPATVALPDATLRVAEGWTARALPIGGWLVEVT